MKHATSLEATLDQLVSNLVRALLDATLRSTLSDFGVASSPDAAASRAVVLQATQRHGAPRRPSRRAGPVTSARARRHELTAQPAVGGGAPSGDEASPPHAITDPALLLQAIHDATPSPPAAPSRVKRAQEPATPVADVAETSQASLLRAGEEVVRRSGAGMVFRRQPSGRA
jgi:hypothetical protein